MLYNQTNQWNGIPMPLLMGYTQPGKIREAENEEPAIYDPVSQTVFEMRLVGTKSLKSHSTGKGGVSDKKNEIDDSKIVK